MEFIGLYDNNKNVVTESKFNNYIFIVLYKILLNLKVFGGLKIFIYDVRKSSQKVILYIHI
ncbi:hypothetical protein CBU02nite_40820 [Clostridium butyricum]|uniref:Uncharacterized protein n=1 Tax=Clostridium butyricum TaxID=1492 RepID=A0A512TTK6_CLOBU|nr:hypothetical protein CBU02nite_40820 [Clostridium butyricum]